MTALPVGEDELLYVGFRDGDAGEGFFYYSPSRESDRGALSPGDSVGLSNGLSLTYLGAEPDAGLQGSLEVNETQRVGAIDLTWLGAESVFFEVASDVPGASGDALIALERFGQARTAEQFNALGGESVRLAEGSTNTSSAGGQVGRPGADGARTGRRRWPDSSWTRDRRSYTAECATSSPDRASSPGSTCAATRVGPRSGWGIGLGIVGMSTTFFMPRRRVWGRVTADRIQLAGQAGHGVDLTSELERLASGEDQQGRPRRRFRSRGMFGGDYAQDDDGSGDDG